MSSQNQEKQVDRKGKGRAEDQHEGRSRDNEEGQDDQQGGKGQGEEKQMKEIRRPPPLPAVKGTIGAIGA